MPKLNPNELEEELEEEKARKKRAKKQPPKFRKNGADYKKWKK